MQSAVQLQRSAPLKPGAARPRPAAGMALGDGDQTRYGLEAAAAAAAAATAAAAAAAAAAGRCRRFCCRSGETQPAFLRGPRPQCDSSAAAEI